VRAVRVALLLLLPLAAASQASDPYVWRAELDGDPALGATVTLTVTLEARRAIDAPLRLELPEWVDAAEPREWRAQAEEGGVLQKAWRLTPARAGFWRASLSVDPQRAEAYALPVDPNARWHPVHGCCLYAWTFDERGLWSPRPEGAVPGESTVGFHPAFRALDAERAELMVRVSPQDRRYVGQELLFEAPPGSDPQRAPADAPHTFAHAFPLASGESATLAAAAFVRVRFDGGEGAADEATHTQPVACATIRVERAGDEVRETARAGCAPPREPETRRVPAGAALAPVAFALAALGARQRSTHHTKGYHRR